MEQEPSAKKVENVTYRVLWLENSTEDLEKIPKDIAESIIEKADQRLSQFPHYVGQPLKGTTKKLWKIRFSKYRVVYTINNKYKEVYILGVISRDVVYRNNSVQSFLRLAIALHEIGKQGGI